MEIVPQCFSSRIAHILDRNEQLCRLQLHVKIRALCDERVYLESATGATVDLPSERMTDNDVAVDGERQNQQLAEVLRQEEEHVEHLADDG